MPPTPESPTQYVSQPAPQQPQPQYPNYQQPQQQPYPQSGYYGYQSPAGYQSYGYPPYRQGTNGLAIASLCCSLASLGCGVTAIVGIVLGIAALSQINKTGRSGRGMALGGIWIGVGVIVAYVAYFVFLFAVVERV